MIVLDDQIAHHPKILRAGPMAAWLWVCGHGYCRRYLTDGVIPNDALSTLMGYPAKTTPHALASTLVQVGLWEKTSGGYRVHDYHAFNPTAEETKDRRAKRVAAGALGGAAKAAQRASKSLANASEVPGQCYDHDRSKTLPVSGSGSGSEKQKQIQERAERASVRSSPLAPGNGHGPSADLDPIVTERAGRFVDRYAALYPVHRHGARYAVKPVRDFQAAVTLCQTWPDDDRLDKLAICFLTTDHDFAANGSRTIPQFLALASWCDGELSQWEHDHRRHVQSAH